MLMADNVFDAPKDMNDRAKALGVNVEVHIELTGPPRIVSPKESAKLRAALNAAHLAVLQSLEAAGFGRA